MQSSHFSNIQNQSHYNTKSDLNLEIPFQTVECDKTGMLIAYQLVIRDFGKQSFTHLITDDDNDNDADNFDNYDNGIEFNDNVVNSSIQKIIRFSQHKCHYCLEVFLRITDLKQHKRHETIFIHVP